MLEREQVKQGCTRAALSYFQIDQAKGYKPVLAELEMSQDESRVYTHKFYIIIADHAAVVYRAEPDRYKVVEDGEDGSQAQEDEAYQVLMCASRYLEKDMRRVRRVYTNDLTSHLLATSPYSARWIIKLDEACCHVVRYDRENGPDYAILEP